MSAVKCCTEPRRGGDKDKRGTKATEMRIKTPLTRHIRLQQQPAAKKKKYIYIYTHIYMRVNPKVPGMATWSENCKWYSSLSLRAVVSLFCKSSEFCRHNLLCCFSTSLLLLLLFISLSTQTGNFWTHPRKCETYVDNATEITAYRMRQMEGPCR
jgi:hypothetical protein